MSIYLKVPILSVIIAQSLKFLIYFLKTQELDLNKLKDAGDFPSSHSSMVTSLMTIIGLTEGFDSIVFSLAFCLGSIVMYDASGVRYETGKQTVTINKLAHKVHLDISMDKLKEKVGHKPIEVAGGIILGIFVAYISYKLSM